MEGLRKERNISRVYADVNTKNPEVCKYVDLFIGEKSFDNYEITRGRRDNRTFEGIQLSTSEKCIVKIFPNVNKKVKREISILQALHDCPNVVQLLDIVYNDTTKETGLIFKHYNYVDFKLLWPMLSHNDIQYYMFELLKALDYAHSHGIMHRNLKPHNIMVDHSSRQLKVADWSLAEYYYPKQDYTVRLSTRYFKPPELLVGMCDYDYSVDMWNFGSILAGIIFQREPFFHGHDNYDQLLKIATILGSENLYHFIDRYGISIDAELRDIIIGKEKKLWSACVSESNQHLINCDVLNLLDSTLQCDPANRLTAQEAMDHPYFDSIRKK